MDWDDLRIFHAVAQAGSLNRAAATVDLHRSTVLRRIERLESALGQRLVDRGTDGISLTAAGERLLPHTERMLDEAVGLAEIADRDPGRPAGRIRVGATYNLAYGLLPKVIAEFRDAFPEISVELAATPDGYSPLRPDDIDIGFRTLEAGAEGHDDMVGRRIAKLPIAVYGADTYLAHTPDIRTPKDLPSHRIVAATGGLSLVAASKWLEETCDDTEPVYRANSMLLLLAAVREGVGLACLPCYLGDREPGLKRVLDLEEALAADLWILRHPFHRDTARMRAFSEFVSDRLADLL